MGADTAQCSWYVLKIILYVVLGLFVVFVGGGIAMIVFGATNLDQHHGTGVGLIVGGTVILVLYCLVAGWCCYINCCKSEKVGKYSATDS
jgi:cytochrome c biogenesis protein CcdA